MLDYETHCEGSSRDHSVQAYAQFYRSPCMMVNVAVRNWRFLYKMGMTGCRWFEGLGNYMEVRKLALTGVEDPTIGPDSPSFSA
jgi:spermidine dehydrogenase